MAAALVIAPDEPERGEAVVITGTGWAASHAFTLEIKELGIIVTGETSGGGGLTTVGLLEFSPPESRPYTIEVNDGTSTITETLDVYQGE